MPNDEPQNNQERLLSDILSGGSTDVVPQNRIERLLMEIRDNGGGGGGGGGTAGVTSFKGRRGAVVPQAGDYTAAMIRASAAGRTVQSYIDEYDANKTPDTALSASSEKPVQNKVITQRILEVEGKVMPSGGRGGAILTKRSDANYDAAWESSDAYMKKAVYDRNNNGKADRSELADAVQGPIYKATLRGTRADTTLLTDEDKGVANGVVPLDSGRKILPEYLPDSITNGLTNGGIFDASTLTVTLSDAAKSILGVTTDTMVLQNSPTVPEGYPANAELYYITTNGGAFAGMTFANGDWLISLGNQWNQLRNGTQVSSVNNMTGAVRLDTDDIPQGVSNLYFTATEKAKLRAIEDGATNDVDVVQTVTKTTLPSGKTELRFANKNGSSVTYIADEDIDLSDYLKVDGDGSNVTTTYSRAASRSQLAGNETLSEVFAKLSRWIYDLKTVAVTASYNDLIDTPQYTGDFVNNGSGNSSYPYVDRRVNNLLYYWNKENSYSKDQIDQLLADIEGFEILIVTQLPTRNIDLHAEYWIEKDDGGYRRYRYVQGAWANLGDTDLNLSEYLKRDGDASATTTHLTIPASRTALVDGETLQAMLGKVAGWYAAFGDVVWGNSATDLDDYDTLALKTDLDDYIKNEFNLSDEGKALVVGNDGKVTLVTMPVGNMRSGDGVNSLIGNDTPEDPVNSATGSRATAFGSHTTAAGNNGFVIGEFNAPDPNSQFAFQIGGGTNDANRKDILDVAWDGKATVAGQISMGSAATPLEMSALNHVTTKYYVDTTIEREIAQAGLLSCVLVDAVPEVADADDNTLYLVPDPTSEGHYDQYKKVRNAAGRYIMANLGGTQVSVSNVQVSRLPVASQSIEGQCYQYVGTSSAYTYGAFYACLPTTFYAWLDSDTGDNYFTDTLDLHPSDPIYATQSAGRYHQATAIGATDAYLDLPNRIRDQFNYMGQPKWYTRDSAHDTTGNWAWVRVTGKLSDYTNDLSLSSFGNDLSLSAFDNDLKLSECENDGTGSGEADDYYLSRKDLLDLVYPVGSVYITLSQTDPATLFGGTWERIKDRFLLATGDTYNVINATGGSKEATLKRSDLPNVNISTSSNGSHKHNSKGYFGMTNGSGNKAMARVEQSGDPLDTNNPIQSAGSHTHSFDLNGNVTQTKVATMPPYLTVNVWKRTA